MSKKRKREKPEEREMTASEFMALPDTEKQKIFGQLEAQTPEQREAESRPLNAAERAQWQQTKRQLRGPGRPRLGRRGTAKVSITVERELLSRADHYAKLHGLARSELFAACVREKVQGAA